MWISRKDDWFLPGILQIKIFKTYLFTYLKGKNIYRERGNGRDIFCPLVYFLNAYYSWGWTEFIPGAKNSGWISHLSGIIWYLPWSALSGRWNWKQSQDFTPRYFIQSGMWVSSMLSDGDTQRCLGSADIFPKRLQQLGLGQKPGMPSWFPLGVTGSQPCWDFPRGISRELARKLSS